MNYKIIEINNWEFGIVKTNEYADDDKVFSNFTKAKQNMHKRYKSLIDNVKYEIKLLKQLKKANVYYENE